MKRWKRILLFLVAPLLVGALAGLIYAGVSSPTVGVSASVGAVCADHGGVRDTVLNPPINGFAWCEDGQYFHWEDGTLQNLERHPFTWMVVFAFIAFLVMALFATKTKTGRRLSGYRRLTAAA